MIKLDKIMESCCSIDSPDSSTVSVSWRDGATATPSLHTSRQAIPEARWWGGTRHYTLQQQRAY